MGLSKTRVLQSRVTIYRFQVSQIALFVVLAHEQIGVLLIPIDRIVCDKQQAKRFLYNGAVNIRPNCQYQCVDRGTVFAVFHMGKEIPSGRNLIVN